MARRKIKVASIGGLVRVFCCVVVVIVLVHLKEKRNYWWGFRVLTRIFPALIS